MASVPVTNLSDVTDRVRRGQFGDALALLDRKFPRNGQGSIAVTILRSELWERVGRTDEAWRSVGVLERCSKLERGQVVRLLLLRGSLERHRGHRSAAAKAYQDSALAAEAAGEHQLYWWARLRLLALGDAAAQKASADAEFCQAERAISRLGDPEIAIALHILCAEWYAKAGWFGDSDEHAAIAESLLTSYPNAWLTGLAYLHRSCLSYLRGDFESAHRNALSALAVAQESGHHQSKCSALVNLGAAYLAIGQSLRAESVLTAARQVSLAGTTPHALAVETLAETWLTMRSLVDCAQLLESVSQEMERYALTLSPWHADWSLSIRIRLKQLLQPDPKVDDESVGKRPPPHSSEDSPVSHRLHLLEAANLIQSRQWGEARQALAQITRSSHRAPAAVVGQLEALKARLRYERDGSERSIDGLRLALMVLSTAGDTADLVKCVSDCARQIWKSTGAPGTCDADWTCRTLHRPLHVTSSLDTVTRLGGDVSHGRDEIADLVGLAWQREQHPALVGELAVRYLACRNHISGAQVVESAGGTQRVIVSFGRHTPSTGVLGAAEVTVDVGTKDGSQFSVVLSMKDTLEAIQEGQAVAFVLRSRIRPLRGTRGDLSAEPTPPSVVTDSGEVFASPSMISLLSLSRRAAVVDGNTLITGESGTGKEVLARYIHESSPRSTLPFVAVNCSAIPKDLVDSQLFGYRRGAYTGATEAFEGLIRSAAGGTLFLDEVADIPMEVQPKLLRFLDAKVVHPLGEPRPISVDVRLIAATNVEPEQLVAAGRFRQDLFYRLNTFRIRIPPLRERREDVEILIDTFFEEAKRRLGRKGVRLSRIARAHLVLYEWPGNVRQLKAEMLRVVAFSDDDATIGVDDLSSEIVHRYNPRASGLENDDQPHIDLGLPLPTLLRSVETLAVQRALRESLGNQSEAARRLGVTRKGLYLMRQRLGC
jgi:DNA-binding NtrC family response regulator